MPRFFVEPSQIKNDSIFIHGEDVKHISKVLRLKNGDKISICNGQGTDYQCIIKNMDKEIIVAQIVSNHLSQTEPKTKITLFQALVKSDKMDLIIQKTVEMGIFKIIPIVTERTVVRFENEKKERSRLARWQKIAESAAKQSQRGIIPEVEPVITLSEAFDRSKEMDCKLIPYEKETDKNLRSILSNFNGGNIAIFIGPEGGFEESEIALGKQQGIIPITLGRRILRTETAGLFTVSIIMYQMGEM
ncbi:MAG: 16S rRNA (uracil(1498)-N(3))-methyltransferase [Epulopiscium sp.]|nr:16S rRNA (uracil(1498)-N(3))-methyltransferase [Candidatus Epulonipiscium sp.]